MSWGKRGMDGEMGNEGETTGRVGEMILERRRTR